ncbi:MAG: hypothetical protein NC340_09685 [Ruminococcus flavefaciens]|nr:hypothetical protein [Ruminococcus flavefaciens]MCM1230588.1 hypothetical protein [Ruminococcus flavefaciens]
MKKKYAIIINNNEKCNPKSIWKYSHKFHQTWINIEISCNYIQILMDMDTENGFDDILRYKIVGYSNFDKALYHAVRSAFLIHMIRYSGHIKIKTLTAKIDGEEKELFNRKNGNKLFPIFSLINSDISEFPYQWKDDYRIADQILKRRISKFNSFDSSLYALLYAKSKDFETERLMYLWMSMNGLYNHFATMYNTLFKDDISAKRQKSISKRSDKEQMKFFSQFNKWGDDTVIREDSNKVAKEIIPILKNYNGNILKENLLPDENGQYHSQLANDIYNALKNFGEDKQKGKYKNITPYGYLLLGLPYYYRCDFFHANKPIAMFSYANEVKCLNLINDLLEDFIEKELFKWFHDDLPVALPDKDDYSEISSEMKDKITEKFTNSSDNQQKNQPILV